MPARIGLPLQRGRPPRGRADGAGSSAEKMPPLESSLGGRCAVIFPAITRVPEGGGLAARIPDLQQCTPQAVPQAVGATDSQNERGRRD